MNNISVYKALGDKYIKSIAKGTPPEFNDFVKLLPTHGLVLDVGCAGGRDSIKFTKLGFGVIGIDAVNRFLKIAKRKCPSAKFIKMDIRKLKFPPNSFDAIWCNMVLHHLERKEIKKVLQNFYKILKINGKIHIMVKWGRGVVYKPDRLVEGQLRKFTLFRINELNKFVRQVGFKIISTVMVSDTLGRKNLKMFRIWAKK